MVAGHLQEKKGYYYIILNLTNEEGKRKQKWISTGLPVKGNKKRAEQRLMEERQRYDTSRSGARNFWQEILFADFMEQWLQVAKNTITAVTYSSYCYSVNRVIVPYFRRHKITLQRLQAKDLQDFYQEQLQRVKASTVLHYHANIHKALQYAMKMELLVSNPADRIERPRPEKFQGKYYSNEELNALFEAFAGTKLELAVLLGAFYGLRRSEIVGLKWDAIDFENNTISIRHTVTSCSLEGKTVVIAKDATKTKSSRRTLPLVPFFREKLQKLKAQQEQNQELCGDSYNREYEGYVYVDALGDLIRPDYITSQFPIELRKKGFRRIRFHDLRHSCASLLLNSGVPMKHIQEWLGHSDFSTTANIYSHLDYSSKLTSAHAMERNFQLEVEKG